MDFAIPMWSIWLIAGIIFIIIEVFTPAFFSFIIGLACFSAGFASVFTPKDMFPGNLIIQLIVFAISLTLMMIFLRPLFLKHFAKSAKKSNIDALIGKEVVVDSDINNISGKGYIKYGADYYKARSSDGSTIKKGSVVIIESFEGITATVSLKN
jgi:membrane protein implicated in regulation of membrane protease activity